MFVQMDARGILNSVFKQFWKFAFVAASVLMIGVVYLLTATPVYQSSAKILIKFGQDARPEMSVSDNRSGLSAEEKRGLVQSNVNIIMSRDSAEALFDVIPVASVYPQISAQFPDADRQRKLLRPYF